MGIWKYANWLTPVDPENRVSLGEGDTPLVRSRRIGPEAGLANLHFKLEGTNPTGSFKDRFAAAAVSHMLQTGSGECVATSSGNTGASLAAYAAAAGVRCRIAIAEAAPLGKMMQMLAYGSDVFRIKGFGLDPVIDRRTFQALKKLSKKPGCSLQVSGYVFSPEGMTGMETLSFELAEQLPSVEHVFCPSGGGGMTVAVTRGFQTLIKEGRHSRSPAVHCVQPAGNDTIATPLREGATRARNVDCSTRISGLQVATVVDGHLSIEACRLTGGTGYAVADEDVWHVQKRLAREEGIFAEPAAAVSLTGALQAAARGELAKDAVIVCVISGIGFKDIAAVDRMNSDRTCPLKDVGVLEGEVIGR